MKIDAKNVRAIPVWGFASGLVLVLWAFWTGFVQLAGHWERDPQYSHGYLVPVIAIALLWMRADMLGIKRFVHDKIGYGLILAGVVGLMLTPASIVEGWGFVLVAISLLGVGRLFAVSDSGEHQFEPSWWGLPLLLGGVGVHLVSGYYYIEWFAHLALIPTLAGLVLMTLGWRGIRWSWPAILFVGFMIPLPHSLEGVLRGPLRMLGTKLSTYLMQTCSLPAFAAGNRHEIIVGGMTHRIGVNEACSGLSMLMIFFALSTAVAVVIQRSIWERLLILVSAVPIAIIANVLRITITGMMLFALQDKDVFIGMGGFTLLDMTGTDFAQSFFHDWAGWMMMPVALFLLWLELAVLKRIIVVERDDPLAVGPTAEAQKPSESEDSGNEPRTDETERQATASERKTTAAVGGTH